jgi:hypothetical protein
VPPRDHLIFGEHDVVVLHPPDGQHLGEGHDERFDSRRVDDAQVSSGGAMSVCGRQ